MRCTRTTRRALTRSISNCIHWRAWIAASLHSRETGSTAALLQIQCLCSCSKHNQCTGEEVEAAEEAAAAWVLRARLILVGAASACGEGVLQRLALSEAPQTVQHGTWTSCSLVAPSSRCFSHSRCYSRSCYPDGRHSPCTPCKTKPRVVGCGWV